MVFELFDPEADVVITAGTNLPHWYQPGVTYFITFRTEDSIPTQVAHQWYQRREEWLQQHGVNPAEPNWTASLALLPRKDRHEFHETFSKEYMDHLDRGHGACVLRRPELSKIVAGSLLHFDGDRYHMGDFVVMPNHVHLLVCLIGATEVESQCYSWKKYTATNINRVLLRTGRFWQEESFDHLVRSPEQFEAVQRYIADNPHKAGLREGEYYYYQRK